MNQKTFNVFTKKCPSRKAFDAIFSRWGILILGFLDEKPARFGELRQSIDGISDKMLSQTLKTLEVEGFLARRDWNKQPPKVEYTLTEVGRKMSDGIHCTLRYFYEALELRENTDI